MKRFIALLMTIVMAISLVACTKGPDRQPAIDAFNKANDAFTEVFTVIKENPDEYTEDVLAVLNSISDGFAQQKTLLEGEEKLTEETMADMIAWYGEVEKWVANLKTELGLE